MVSVTVFCFLSNSAVTGQVQNQRREIRRPPPFAAHYSSTVTSQRGMDEIDSKPVVKSKYCYITVKFRKIAPGLIFFKGPF